MVIFLTVAGLPGSERDVRLDLLAGGVDVFRETGDLEDGLLVPRGRHYVGVRLLLDALDGRALRTHDQANDPVGNAYLRQGEEMLDMALGRARVKYQIIGKKPNIRDITRIFGLSSFFSFMFFSVSAECLAFFPTEYSVRLRPNIKKLYSQILALGSIPAQRKVNSVDQQSHQSVGVVILFSCWWAEAPAETQHYK